MTKNVKKILIIRFSSLGDVLLASPLIRLLKQQFPESRLDFIVGSEYSDLVRYNPHLAQILEFEVADGFVGLRKLKKLIWQQKYDIILDIHRSLRSLYLTMGIAFNPFSPTRVYRIKKQQFIRFLLVKFKINLYRKIYGKIFPVWEKYVKTAEPLGLTPDNGRLELYLPDVLQDQMEERVKKLPGDRWDVVIAAGAKHFTKRWPAHYFAELIKKVYTEFGMRTILVGSPADEPVIQDILHNVPPGMVSSQVGKLSILETAGLIKRARLVVSNDSGLMHIASAFSKPLIAIFGPTVEELGFFPVSKGAVVLENKGLYCRPCSHIGLASCPEKHFKCMLDITPDDVMSSIRKNFGRLIS